MNSHPTCPMLPDHPRTLARAGGLARARGHFALRRATASLLALTMLLAACGVGASPPSGGPNGTADPSAVPTLNPEFDHPTGATDVVFRFEEGGGFVPMGFFATQAPQFTLYGDGTVIFRDSNAALQGNSEIIALPPFWIGQLTESQIREFLRFALEDGGLRAAGPSYTPGNIADAPTAIFTANIGGLTRTVSVEALGYDNPESPDAAILRTLATLGERLRNFAPFVEGETIWTPDRWRGALTPDAYNPPVTWPWPDLVPADFVAPTGQGWPEFPIHTLTPDHVAALGLVGIEGGFVSLALTGPDGKDYTLALRPILPDELR